MKTVRTSLLATLLVVALFAGASEAAFKKKAPATYTSVSDYLTKENKKFKTMALAATAAGLMPTFSDSKLAATVFLPTEEAFNAYMKETSTNVGTLLKNLAKVGSTVQYHVSKDKAYPSFKLFGKTTLTMMNGQTVEVSRPLLSLKYLNVKDASGRTVKAELKAITAGATSIYVLQNVLQPK